MTDKSTILFFVKSPEKGKVKSRLASAVGEEAALEIYTCLVSELLETLKKTGHAFRICFFPRDARERIMKWLGSGHAYLPQEGKDLGERMRNAFVQSFSEGAERAVLIGSDIPDVTPSLLRDALESLNTHEAVIGPALDGGYYLIGFTARSFLPAAFDGVAWSTDGVFEQTVGMFRKAGRNVRVLRPLQDIDTPADLRAFAERNLPGTPERGSAMRRILQHKELFP